MHRKAPLGQSGEVLNQDGAARCASTQPLPPRRHLVCPLVGRLVAVPVACLCGVDE